MPTLRTTAGLVGLATLGAAAICLAQTPEQAPKKDREPLLLNAAGNDEYLWLMVGEKTPKEKAPVNRLAYLDRNSATIHASPALPQVGQIVRAAVAGDILHVFFADGVHQHYGVARASRRGLRLPGGDIPEAVAGGVSNGMTVLWAVVGADTADAVARNWAETQRRAATQPGSPLAESQPETQASIGPRIEGGYSLVMYDGADWRPGMAVPDTAAGAVRLWLCTSPGRFHLFWETTRTSTNIQYAWFENGQWTQGPPVVLSAAPVEATVQVANTEVAFAALLPESHEQLRVSCWRRSAVAGTSTKWTESAELNAEPGKPLLLPRGAAIAVFGSSLALLQDNAGKPELGMWSLARGGTPESAFRQVPLRRLTGEPQGPPAVREFTTTIIVAFILLLVFWRRQTSFAMPLALPPGLRIASPAKRFLGALIDMAPALIVVFWYWHAPLLSFFKELQAAANDAKTIGATPYVTLPETLIWAEFTFLILYAVYCTIFELWLSTTPGKRVMGCYVLSESLTRPNWLQIAIRNASRIIELQHYLSIWPFLLVIFLTRSRQRVGDLLARTIVVDREYNYAAPPESPEE